ncbi:MAG: Fucose 4-O-acetylase and related acetyltransferase-like protein [Sphaerisporangium sp.]|nr:Fucose 4-O-acetylase and related acetyltransferase-like protein [Sphaerisporangium sp.]
MSDTRSSFQVPAPRTDGVSTDADEVQAPGERGQQPIDPGRDADVIEEEAPTARWPVPDYAEPPTGSWDRQRPRTGEHAHEPLWPVAEPPETAKGADRPGPGQHAGPASLDDDPETFTFARPTWEEPSPPASSPSPAPPSPAPSHPASASPASRDVPPSGRTAGDLPQPAEFARDAPQPPVPAWEAPRGPQEEAAGGFSYWERRPLPDDPAPATWGGQPWGQEPERGGKPAWDGPAPEPEQAPAPAPVKRPREPYLDNVKFVLIALVVTGHSLVPTLATHSSRSAYLFIYVFHMPLFVLISGYLSRNFWNSNAKTNKLVDTFLVPYVIVEVGYAALRFALGHAWSLTIMDPAWLNWYLLALLLWRLSTPVWKRMRYPLPIAVAIYLLAGLSDLPGDFSMDRFFGLMPFFVLGLWLQPHHFEMLNRVWIKILSVGVIVGAAGVAILVSPRLPLAPIYFKDSYAALHFSWWMGMAMRTALLVAALTVSAAILALVPRRNTWFSDLGTRTLYCYLLHGVPVLIAKDMGWLSFPWLHGPLGVMAIMSGCFALAIVLCLPETRTLFKWLLEPRLVWLYRRPSSEATGSAP